MVENIHRNDLSVIGALTLEVRSGNEPSSYAVKSYLEWVQGND